MDLVLFGHVMWRFKYVLVLGLALAATLAFLSFVNVSTSGRDHFRYREQQQWTAYSTLFVTQRGFQSGELNPTSTINPTNADPARFASLALLYAQFITSDAVRKLMEQKGPVHGTIEAAAITTSPGSTDALPLVSVAGTSTTPQAAKDLVARATDSFLTYVDQQQQASGTPADQRVVVNVLNQPGRLTLTRDRSKTLPIVVFLTVTMAAIGICFILENIRPRKGSSKPDAFTVDESRRSA